MIKQLSRGDVSFSSCQEENWKFFVLLEHLSSYNFVQRATNIKLRANGLNIVGQQLPTMLGVVASVARRLKFSLFQTLGSNSQQHATTCSRECKRTQHITSNNVGGCWPTMLRLFVRGFRCLHRVTSHSSADFLSCSESPSFPVNNRREAKLMTLAWVVVWKYSF